MKLAELSTDKALDVLCELTPYVSGICGDSELLGTLGEQIDVKEDMNLYGQFAVLMGRVSSIVPMLLKGHRPEVYGILSVLNEKTVAEIAAQPVGDTIRQVKEVFQDSDLLDFFKSFMQRGRSAPSAPSADSPGSE